MKSHHIRNSFLIPRYTLIASLTVALGSSTCLLAQSGGAGNKSYESSSTTSGASSTTGSNANEAARSNRQTTPSNSDYQSRAAADVDATVDVNTRNAANGTGRDKLSWGDRRFVTKAADGGHDEVQLAQLAAQRATNPEVKNFAQKLVDDHTKVNSELMSLASKKNVKVDADDDKDRSYKRLNKKSGAAFDEEFVEHMIDEHEKDIKLFEKASNEAKDPEVRAFASKHVGHLREHLQRAQGLRQAVMPTGRVDDTSSGRITPSTSSGSSTSSPSGTSTSTSSGTSTSSPSGSSTTSPSSDPSVRPNKTR